ncbi:MAG: 3-phosphoshikimate 1-carboxyvinyltransferase [Clostridia bacterium]|nr:3-phosphoshikimate 1-carboxyvinyltransferase [Clostridia bacterium]
MDITIKKIPTGGRITAPSSKSEAHRLLIAAALSESPTEIKLNVLSDDISATADCLSSLGAGVTRTEYGFLVTPIRDVKKDAVLRVRESGSTLRFLLPVAAALGGGASFVMEGRLPERPLFPLDAELCRHGASLGKNGNILTVSGKTKGGEYKIRADVSSQFISGLLFSLPLSGGGKVTLEGRLESADYVKMTVDAMRAFGVEVREETGGYTVEGKYSSPGKVTVGGDFSGAAFYICAGALTDEITVSGLDMSSSQGDRRIVDIVRGMGANVTVGEDFVTVSRGKLHGTKLDASDVPDLVPTVAALAACADGVTEITGAARLRLKESDRIATVAEMLRALGTEVTEKDDGLTVVGGKLCGGTVDSHGDHRIAMSAAVAALGAADEVTVRGAECVSKSYPTFWNDYNLLGGVAK